MARNFLVRSFGGKTGGSFTPPFFFFFAFLQHLSVVEEAHLLIYNAQRLPFDYKAKNILIFEFIAIYCHS